MNGKSKPVPGHKLVYNFSTPMGRSVYCECGEVVRLAKASAAEGRAWHQLHKAAVLAARDNGKETSA